MRRSGGARVLSHRLHSDNKRLSSFVTDAHQRVEYEWKGVVDIDMPVACWIGKSLLTGWKEPSSSLSSVSWFWFGFGFCPRQITTQRVDQRRAKTTESLRPAGHRCHHRHCSRTKSGPDYRGAARHDHQGSCIVSGPLPSGVLWPHRSIKCQGQELIPSVRIK
jgi:hypothetical protein